MAKPMPPSHDSFEDENEAVLNDPDPVRTAMLRHNVPVTRENYLAWAFPGTHPDLIPPENIPEEFRNETDKRIIIIAKSAKAGSS
jgi:hypothetical protein